MSFLDDIVLLGIAGTAMMSDLYTGKITNRMLALGFFFSLLTRFLMNGADGIVSCLTGTLIVVVPAFALWCLNAVGAGDAKLFAVIGGLKGAGFCIEMIGLSLFLGGMAGLYLLFVRKKDRCLRIHFAPAVAAAALLMIVIGRL